MKLVLPLSGILGKCPPVQPPRWGVVRERVLEDGTLQMIYSCEPGRKLKGHRLATCTADGWDRVVPECVLDGETSLFFSPPFVPFPLHRTNPYHVKSRDRSQVLPDGILEFASILSPPAPRAAHLATPLARSRVFLRSAKRNPVVFFGIQLENRRLIAMLSARYRALT